MRDVCIVGAGVAGLSAAIFTARADLETLVVDGGESILARNASLENYPGFPDGVDARRYLQVVRDQATAAGATIEPGRVVRVTRRTEGRPETGFRVVLEEAENEGGERPAGVDDGGSAGIDDGGSAGVDDGGISGTGSVETRRLIAASWPDSDYLRALDVDRSQRGSKHFLDVGHGGRTAVEGLYGAGRLAGQPHQTVVAAGHGARVGLAAIHDADVAFYHDRVTPAGYFTGRGREIPPGCEEIDGVERRRRDERAREAIAERYADPLGAEPTMHPNVEEG